jgi:hypothetical protein
MYNPSILVPYDYAPSACIAPYSKERRLYLHPNPTHDGIGLFGELYGFVKMELYDLTGRKLTETKNFTFDLSLYNAGIYLIRVHFDNGETLALKGLKK